MRAKSIDLTLDNILRHKIKPNKTINDQTLFIKISAVVIMLMFFVGLINSICYLITFKNESVRKVGGGLYLFASSGVSLMTISMLTIKFWFVVLTQMNISTHRSILKGGCDTRDANVYGTDQHTWCALDYSRSAQDYNTAILFIHLLSPCIANICSALYVIFGTAYYRAVAHDRQAYKQHIRRQWDKLKEIVIGPIIIILLSIPHLIISALSGCLLTSFSGLNSNINAFIRYDDIDAINILQLFPTAFGRLKITNAELVDLKQLTNLRNILIVEYGTQTQLNSIRPEYLPMLESLHIKGLHTNLRGQEVTICTLFEIILSNGFSRLRICSPLSHKRCLRIEIQNLQSFELENKFILDVSPSTLFSDGYNLPPRFNNSKITRRRSQPGVTIILDRILPQIDPYCHASFLIEIALPQEYPFKVPEITCLDRLYHSQVKTSGKLCACENGFRYTKRGDFNPTTKLT
ncbi:hypothetical protein I4U23_004366 [Adineta vaga]|nr:hypothetical protein I4U23_004366 [Adineta vaga]